MDGFISCGPLQEAGQSFTLNTCEVELCHDSQTLMSFLMTFTHHREAHICQMTAAWTVTSCNANIYGPLGRNVIMLVTP